MVLLRSFHSSHFHILVKTLNPSCPTPHYVLAKAIGPSLILERTISLSADFEAKSIDSNSDAEEIKEVKKPLHVLFKEAVGLSPKLDCSDSGSEAESETNEVKRRLRKLEKEVRMLREGVCEGDRAEDLKKPKKDSAVSKSESKPKSLYKLFADKKIGSEESADTASLLMEDPIVHKKLSTDAALFVNHLYKKGYFANANFLPRNKFDASCFEPSYARNFVKYAAEKFGKDNREIAKWLSASDLKKVAAFGCPSMGRKSIFSAKRLRTFFEIQEETVCRKCALKSSCKFVNQSVWKGDFNILDLAVVMRVITLYALESFPPQLIVPDEIKASASRLLAEVVNLSETRV